MAYWLAWGHFDGETEECWAFIDAIFALIDQIFFGLKSFWLKLGNTKFLFVSVKQKTLGGLLMGWVRISRELNQLLELLCKKTIYLFDIDT